MSDFLEPAVRAGIQCSYFWYPLIDSEDAGYIR